MRKLIRGDIARILCKKEIYIFGALLYCILIFWKNKTTAEDQIELFHTMVDFVGLLICLVAVYLTVYGDEMRAGSMQIVIGRGMSRRKVVISKVIDCVILFTIMFMGFLLVFYIKNAVSHVVLTPKQNLMVFMYVFVHIIKAACYFALSGLFLFASWNTAIGLIGLILLVCANIAFVFVQTNTHIPVYDYWIDGLGDSVYNDIVINDFPWKVIPLLAFYLVVPVLITEKIFDRKELDL